MSTEAREYSPDHPPKGPHFSSQTTALAAILMTGLVGGGVLGRGQGEAVGCAGSVDTTADDTLSTESPAVAQSFAALVMDEDGYIEPHECGGVGQTPCELSRALKLGKVRNPKPNPRAFEDPRLDDPSRGAEWWSCPAGFDRTIFGITSDKACEKRNSNPGHGSFEDPRNGGEYWRCDSGFTRTLAPVTAWDACLKEHGNPGDDAFVDPREGGEYWRCPSGYPNRTIYSVTGHRACERSPGPGEFTDPNGKTYSCDGWRRTIFPVTAHNACETGFIFTIQHRHAREVGPSFASANFVKAVNEKRAAHYEGPVLDRRSATLHGPVLNPQPAGSFKDPRLDDLSQGEEYWRCPDGFWRNANPVTHHAACTVNIGQNCDAGNIAVGTPWNGYTCEVRNLCGAKGQRPCQIVERIPSCDGGLAEDFLDNKCVDERMAMCLTVVRAGWLAKQAKDGMDEATQKVVEPITTMVENVVKGLPREVREALDTGTRTFEEKLLGPARSTIEEQLSEVTSKLEVPGPAKDATQLGRRLQSAANSVTDLFTDSAICSMTPQELFQRADAIGGFSQLETLSSAKPTRSWSDPLLDLLVPRAYASSPVQKIWGTLGLSSSLVFSHAKGVGGGASVDLYTVVDFARGEAGLYFGFGGVFGFNLPTFSVEAYAGVKLGTTLADVPGWTSDVAVTLPIPVLPSTDVELVPVSLAMAIPDEGSPFLDGITVSLVSTEMLGNKRGIKPLAQPLRLRGKDGAYREFSISVGAGYEWSLASPSRPTQSGSQQAREARSHWSFEGSGTEARDQGANQLHATLSGDARFAASAHGQGLVLRQGGYASIPDSSAIDFGANQDFTVSAWVRPEATQSDTGHVDNALVEKWSASGGYPFVMRYLNQTAGTQAGKVQVARYDGSAASSMTSAASIDDGRFHHVAFVKRGSELSLYIDGALDQTTTDQSTGATANDSALFLGRRGGGTNTFDGALDDLRIYDVGLSASEVSAEAGSGPIRAPDSLLSFDGVSGTSAVDSGENGLNAVLSSGANTSAQRSRGSLAASPALALSGGGYASIPDSSALDFGPSEDFTVAVWVKPEAAQSDVGNADNAIVEKWAGVGGYPFVIRYRNQSAGSNAGKVMVARYDGAVSSGVTSSRRIDDGRYHHVAFVKRGSQLELYIDGVLDGSATDASTGSTANDSPLYLGRRGSGVNQFDGALDDLRVYSSSLSAAEVMTLTY